MLGLLGALDPYKHKVNLGQISMVGDSGAVLSESKAEEETGQGGETYHMLVCKLIFSTA